ncbi:hypothetical protein B0H15DRAFT_466191 [Mycena belliarum]|uniref:DUF6534 domain-containing protein n=1 Tax=Mycena belliarum TaxID=1033014 RepID=A0AAD6TZ07_9AGAR|nr:hypothetical protein B0H15DRAFT_466191 [Mycena belliae]
MFLGHRVYLLTSSKVLFALISVLSVLGFVFGCFAGIKSGIINEIAKFAPLAPYVTAWLAFQTSADLLITLCLTVSLARSKTGFRTTDTIINRLIRCTIQTGLFASIFALADLFSFLLHRDTNLYAMVGRLWIARQTSVVSIFSVCLSHRSDLHERERTKHDTVHNATQPTLAQTLLNTLNSRASTNLHDSIVDSDASPTLLGCIALTLVRRTCGCRPRPIPGHTSRLDPSMSGKTW